MEFSITKLKRMMDLHIITACFSQDGRRLLASHHRGVGIWDTATGELITELLPPSPDILPGPRGLPSHIISVALSPTGRLALLGLRNGGVLLYSAQTGELKSILLHPRPGEINSSILAVGFSPDESIALVGYAGRAVGLFAVLDGSTIAYFENPHPFHTEQIITLYVQASPDNRYVFAGFGELSVTIWDAQSGEIVLDELEYGQPALDVFGDDTGVRWATPSGHVWAARGDEPAHLLLHTTEYWYEARFSPDGESLLVRTGDGAIKLYDLQTGQSRHLTRHRVPEGWPPFELSHNIQGLEFTLTGDRIITITASREIRVVSLGRQAPSVTIRTKGGILRFAVAPDDKTLAVWDRSHVLTLWSLVDGRLLFPLHGLQEASTFAFSPDSSRLAVGFQRARRQWDTLIWNVLDQTIDQLLMKHRGHIGALAFTKDGQLLITASSDNTLRLWDLGSQETVLRTITQKHLYTTDILVLPDGDLLLAESHKLERWKAGLEQLLWRIPLYLIRRSWRVSADYQTIIAASGPSYQRVQQWSLATGELVREYRPDTQYPDLMLQQQLSEAGVPDVFIWRYGGSTFVHSPRPYMQWLFAANLSADGRWLLLPSDQGASLVSLEEAPRIVQAYELGGHCRAGCVAPDAVLILNTSREILRFPFHG